jgi:DNA-binding NarL/FixJ family response regulator
MKKGKRAKAVRVLIVEDDYIVASQAEAALIESGFEVVGIADSVADALWIAADAKPDFAIMDIRLKGSRDGIDGALELLNAQQTRCIFATAHYDPDTRRRAAAASPLGWLPKPYSADALVAAARQASREIAPDC